MDGPMSAICNGYWWFFTAFYFPELRIIVIKILDVNSTEMRSGIKRPLIIRKWQFWDQLINDKCRNGDVDLTNLLHLVQSIRDLKMSQTQSSSPPAVPSTNSRSPVTLGDFIKRRGKNKNKSSPGNNQQQYSNLYARENAIDFSVNDIQFENVQNKRKAVKELKWSENDVNFTIDTKTCSYKKCLKNDDNIRPFNNFRVPTYISNDSDINFNNEHFFLPETQSYEDGSTSYFQFDKVEIEDFQIPDGDFTGKFSDYYQHGGTTYYNVEDQLNSSGQSSSFNICDGLVSLQLESSSASSEDEQPEPANVDVEDLEKDVELNNIVFSIIDDD